MEMGGFTGDRLWMIAAVIFFNLGCVFLWFVLGALRRGQTGTLLEARTFIELMRQEAEARRATMSAEQRARLAAGLEAAEAQLAEGEGLGPLWGRRSLTRAALELHGVADRFPDLAAPVNERMLRR